MSYVLKDTFKNVDHGEFPTVAEAKNKAMKLRSTEGLCLAFSISKRRKNKLIQVYHSGNSEVERQGYNPENG